MPGREVAFPALRATRTERESEGLGRVGRTNTRQITSFLPLLYDVDHEQPASLPSFCSPPLSFCGHQVNEDADEEEGATERKTDGRTDGQVRQTGKGSLLRPLSTVQGDCEEFVELLMVLREWCLGHTVRSRKDET